MLAKLMSPDSRASAERATNCRLVNPVSNASGTCSAQSTTFDVVMMPSNRVRREIGTQSLVVYAFCVQSYCGSLAMNSWPKYVVSALCRSSSSWPKVAMLRQAPFRPNLAIFSSASTAVYSTCATPPKCIFVDDFQPSSRWSKIVERDSAAFTAYVEVSFSRCV